MRLIFHFLFLIMAQISCQSENSMHYAPINDNNIIKANHQEMVSSLNKLHCFLLTLTERCRLILIMMVKKLIFWCLLGGLNAEKCNLSVAI